VRIDHVIYATADLDQAATRVHDELGLTAVEGGRHQGHGTHNRIVPLGDGYLELMAVADPEEASSSPIGQALEARLREAGEGLFAWAIEVDDVEPLAERIGAPLTEVAREGLTARLTGVPEALSGSALPFFISRDHGVRDPGAGNDAGGITWIELACDRAELDRRLDGTDLPVRLVEGPPGIRAMGIGDRELRTG
jgi:catechol 2,3-dioxygenase-like lactoylglutathione lyase family enzyme